MSSPIAAVLVAVTLYLFYSLCRPLWSVYRYYGQAKRMRVPVKVIPFPPGAFSFIAHLMLRRLGLMKPGTKLHTLLNMGRPDNRGMHDELGDIYVTVNPLGLTLMVADPKVAAHVNTKRSDFPKPPNTGALINIYGRNVINADGEIWRFHRRVTGPVFSERIHADVWQQSIMQAHNMIDAWSQHSDPARLLVPTPQLDTLRLGFNVITSAAYGCPLKWDESPPYRDLFSNSTSNPRLSYRDSLSQVNAHLLQLFLTPRWLLRLAPPSTSWGRAWEAYTTFGGYMRGMIEREKEIQADGGGSDIKENLLSVLLDAQNGSGLSEKEERKMTPEEVMGNAFIFIFAGHETTANTTHYALVRLALHEDVQDCLLSEIDAAYYRVRSEGRQGLDYDRDFSEAKYAMAVMNETLRIHTPTGITNKYAEHDQKINFTDSTGAVHASVIPAGTRISINGTAIHFSKDVWGDDAEEFRPSRWIVDASTPATPSFDAWKASQLSRPVTPSSLSRNSSPNPSPTISNFSSRSASPDTAPSSVPPSLTSSPESKTTPLVKVNVIPPPLNLSKPEISAQPPTSSKSLLFPGPTAVLKPPKGTFLPFSEGSRMCSGKKFASVEFVAVLYTLLRDYRVELALDQPGWTKERVLSVLKGRKAGALTLAVPEHIPLRFVKRTVYRS